MTETIGAPRSDIDFAQTFQIEGQDVRGRLVRLGPALDQVLTAHGYPDVVSNMLAETLVLAATLASALKYEGIFTLQTQSDGPISLLVADVTSDGALRGYARFDADRVAEAETRNGAPVPRLLGQGHLAFTVDQGADMDRYQGVTELDGATLAECAHHYFRNSEQLDTAIYIAARTRRARGEKSVAGALMVQRMPHGKSVDPTDAEDAWRRAVAILASLTDDELLDSGLDHDQLLFRLYHEDGVRAHAAQALFHRCRCSRDKVANTLKSFPRAEIIDQDGHVGVVCEFCKSAYAFAPDELDRLFGATDA
ncbi:MAG: Hsp33 family molecular chaperone HslO [Alphaproteobacteria bacterium]|nr:Hsp33 family molecular chaperone HslO [Alphaproteobacteria bacterium]MBF0251313.1 Hsp33 family molecular chaperone HslO [Alphaproteobacteria bacterium]